MRVLCAVSLVYCLSWQPGTLLAAQDLTANSAVAARAEAMHIGKADDAWDPEQGPALTGTRRPLYRLQRSDVLEIHFHLTPEFDQTVTVQPDGFIPLRGAGPIQAEGVTLPELRELIAKAGRTNRSTRRAEKPRARER